MAQPPRIVADANSPRRVTVATSLRILHEVLELDHLHYGLWEGEELNLNGLRAAQDRYCRELCSWVPEGVRTVLDVGAGVGTTALHLQDLCYEVEGLSPDPYQQKVFRERSRLPFHLCRLQEFEPQRSYDLTLMSESAQYIWLDTFFDHLRRATPEGWLLVADYFVRDDAKKTQNKSGHPIGIFLRLARENGLILEREEDVTERVLPTLELGRRWIDQFGLRPLSILDDRLRQRHPRMLGMAKWILRRKIDKTRAQIELFDTESFSANRRYLFLLFRVEKR